jgi:ABC-type dipeptide/oligopeptide/nickel transport system ATPase component
MEGEVWYRDQNVLCLKGKALRDVRGRGLAYIFQDPGTSLNPVFTVGAQIAEAVKRHCPEVSEVRHHVVGLLERVGIEAEGYRSYPHELSGGMQQRIMIAMALACRPKILIADEPTTALDVTIQKQIMDLLTDLQQKEETSILLITHNFGIVKGFANRILVMFRGKIVEQGTAEEVIEAPRHPYTKALVACIPRIGDRQSRLATIDYSQIS